MTTSETPEANQTNSDSIANRIESVVKRDEREPFPELSDGDNILMGEVISTIRMDSLDQQHNRVAPVIEVIEIPKS